MLDGMRQRFRLIPAVYLLFARDRRILLLRRANTGYEDGNYGLVSGHGEAGESLRMAAMREAKEEAGIDLDPQDLMLRTTMQRGDASDRIDFFFEPLKWTGEPWNAEPDRCDDMRWFAIDDLPGNTIPYVRHAIACWRQGIVYSEFAW